MNVRQAWCTGAVIGLLAASGAGYAATTLPYAQNFEGAFPDAHWVVGGGGTVGTSASAVKTGAGTQGLIVSNDTVTLDVQDATYNNAWIQIYARPVKGASDPTVSGVNGAFYITTAGQLKAYSGGVWVNVGGETQFSAPTYYGFIIHADYENDEWDIYTTAGDYKTDMVKLNGAALEFTLPATHLDEVIVESGDRAYIDAVAVSRAYDAAGSNTRVAVHEHASSATPEAQFTLPAYSASYTASTNKTVGGQIGNHIRSGLVNGDKLLVWSAMQPDGFSDFRVVAGVFDPSAGSTPSATSGEPIYTMTSLKLDQNNTRSDTFGFYPYVNTTVLALDGAIQPSASGSAETLVLNGIGGGAGQHLEGWTALNYSSEDTVNTLIFNSPANFTANDEIFISMPSTPNSWTWYRWNGTAWQRRTGGTQPTIPAGANMWVKRQAAAPANVPVVY